MISRVTTQFDKNNSTLQNIPELAAVLAAGSTYRFRVLLFCGGGGDVRVSAGGGSATAESFIGSMEAHNDDEGPFKPSVRAGALGDYGSFTGEVGRVVVEGTITAAAGGTFIPQFASGDTGLCSVLPGSYMEVTDIT